MDLSESTNPLWYLPRWVNQESVVCFGSLEIKNRSKQLSGLLSSRILQEIAPADEIICRNSCEYDCDLRVKHRRDKIFLICPRHQIAPKEISENEIKRYNFNLPAFLSALAQANGIVSENISHQLMDFGLYQMGKKKIRGEEITFCLALGLPKDNLISCLLSLRILIKGGRIAVLFPSYAITDQSQLQHLAANQIYLLTLIDTLETGTLKLNWEKVTKAIWTKSELTKDVVLTIDTKKRLVIYKNQSTTLPPKAFDLLLLLANRAEEVVSREEIYTIFWGDTAADDKPTYDRQIDDHKSKIKKALLELRSRKTGITKKEIDNLIDTRKKVGFQLKLPPQQVEII